MAKIKFSKTMGQWVIEGTPTPKLVRARDKFNGNLRRVKMGKDPVPNPTRQVAR